MEDLRQFHHVHIVGIGGAGMSAIARVLHGRGFVVHGSDRQESPLAKALHAEGISTIIGHAPENVGAADLVLVSSAVPDDNVELLEAQRRGIRVMGRPEFLFTLTAGYDVIAVAGAHGKTTVTGMITLLMLDAGFDPTFIVGGVLGNLSTNARAGSGSYFVIEADEYRNTFLSLMPKIAVVTNVEFDHPDCFPSLRFVRLAFGDFVDNIRPDGMLVACNDDEVTHAIAASYHANGGRLMLYGHHEGVGLAWRATEVRPNDLGGVTFVAIHAGVHVGEVSLRIPGEYNALNALAVLCVADALGINWEVARRSLERFKGTARRFEVLGDAAGIVVIDDYAHHPTQIRQVLAAARQRYPGRRIIAAWEPHTFSRIKALYYDFIDAFGAADQVVVLPIYAAREIDDGSLTAEGLAERIAHLHVVAASSLDEAVQMLAGLAQPGDVMLMLGAGNEYLVGQQVLEELRKRSKE